MKRFNKIVIIAFALLIPFLGVSQKQKKKKKKDKEETVELGYKESRQAETLFLNGMKYYMLEDYEKALLYFKKSHAIHPNSAGTNFQIAQLLMGFGQALEAEPYCEKALSVNDSNVYYYQLLAQCYTEIAGISKQKERQVYLKKAAEVYESLIKNFPREDDAYFELANLYMQIGDVNEGLKAIGKIEEKYGITEEISFEKRAIYLRLNKFEDAVHEGQRLIDAYPDVARYKVEQAQLFFSNSKPEEAQKILEALEKNEELDGQGKVLLSDVYWAMEKKDQSNGILIEAFEDPNYPIEQKVNIIVGFINAPGRLTPDQLEKSCSTVVSLHPTEPKGYVAYGDFLLRQERKTEARTRYLTALSMDDSYFQVWQNVIILDADLNQQDSIIKHTDSALELFPNQGILWYYNGSAHLVTKKFQEAANAFERAKKLSQSNQGLLMIINAQLGDTYYNLKDYPKSDAAYEEVLDIDPNYTHVLNNYSYFLSLRNEKLTLAEAMCERLIRIEPDNSTYLDTYAWVLYKMDDFDKSKTLLERALENSSDATIIEHYGDVLYKLGDEEGAVEQWKLAKSKGEFSELLEKKLANGKLYE